MNQNNLLVLAIFSTLLFSTTSTIVCQGPNAIQYATGYATNDHLSCACSQPLYIWRASVHKCVRNCAAISNSVNNCLMDPLTPIDQCQCLPGFRWVNQDCVRDCSNDDNSFKTFNTSYIEQCACLWAQDYLWDYNLKKCVKNCTGDPQKGNNLAGLKTSDTSYSTCLCQPSTLQYQSLSNTCEKQCKSDVNAHVIDQFGNCACNVGYAPSIQFGGKCTFVCPVSSSNTLGYLGGNQDVNTCKCDKINGYTFITQPSRYQYKCGVDCTNVINSRGSRSSRTTCFCKDDTYQYITSINSPPGFCQRACTGLEHINTNLINTDINICICQSPWVFQYLLDKLPQGYGLCVLDCSKDPNVDTTQYYNGNIDINTCQPKTGFTIDTSDPNNPVSKRDCTFDSVHLTGALQSGSNTDCACKLPNQVWIQPSAGGLYAGNCAVDCSNTAVKYVINQRDGQDSCICQDPTNFQFTNTQIGCTRRCGPLSTDLPRSLDYKSTDQSQCECINGYHFSVTSGDFYEQCVIDCTADTYTKITHTSQTQCACNFPTLYQYNPIYGKCTRYCSGLANSDGTLDTTVTTLDACNCDQGFLYSGATGPFPNSCYRDCSSTTITYSTGNLDIDSCTCDNQHFFEQRTTTQAPTRQVKNLYKCVRNCNNVANSFTQYNPDAINQCLCLKGYVWNPSTKTCDDPCGVNSLIPNSVSTLCYDPLKCDCDTNYDWDPINLICGFRGKARRLLVDDKNLRNL